MSDDTQQPPEDSSTDDEGATEEDAPSPDTPRFFDDGLEEPPSMHAAADRASLSIAKEPPESSEPPAPSVFPIPIELSLFQGAPPPVGEPEPESLPENDAESDEAEVISLMPIVAATGAVWDLNPAGEETIRDAFDEGQELVPPEPHMLEGTIEAILFTAEQPLTMKQIHAHLANPGLAVVREAVLRIKSRFQRPGSGIRLVEVSKGWQFRTDMRTARYVSAMRGIQPVKLSKAALETLSIVAYRQPVTRSEVEDLRGVDPGGILRMLAERGLVCVTGRKDEPGRPLLYGTTPDFLSMFGLRDLSDLPTLRDLRELQQDDSRGSIGSTDIGSVLDVPSPDEHPPPLTPMVSVQEPLPLDGLDPID